MILKNSLLIRNSITKRITLKKRYVSTNFMAQNLV